MILKKGNVYLHTNKKKNQSRVVRCVSESATTSPSYSDKSALGIQVSEMGSDKIEWVPFVELKGHTVEIEKPLCEDKLKNGSL